MAGFTSYMGVFPGSPGFGLIFVTKDTGILPSKSDGMLADLHERTGRIVPILSKSFGDDGASNNKEDCQTAEQYDGRQKQMSGIAE